MFTSHNHQRHYVRSIWSILFAFEITKNGKTDLAAVKVKCTMVES